jgi:tetratricopeptide (TPR) repeat protein
MNCSYLRSGSLLPVALAIGLALVALYAAAADNDMRPAIALYNQRNYAAALQSFTIISTKEPANSSALYYAANCEIGLGHTTAAIILYRRLIANSPTSAEAASARNVLQRMGMRFESASTASAEPGKAGSRSASQGDRRTDGKSGGNGDGKYTDNTFTSSSRTPLSADAKDRIIDKFVVPVRALAGRPDISEMTISSVKESLKQYPSRLLGVLYAKGCKVYVTPTLIDKEPQLVNRQPAGYEEGETYRNCPGMFNGSIVLCEKVFVGDGPDLRRAPDIIGTLRHELGHAVDWYLGNLTAKDDYKHQYLLDLGTIDDETKAKLAYFCQKDFRGPKETFAELMCFKYGGRPSGSGRTDLVGSSFKLTRSYVDRVINEVDGSKSAHM